MLTFSYTVFCSSFSTKSDKIIYKAAAMHFFSFYSYIKCNMWLITILICFFCFIQEHQLVHAIPNNSNIGSIDQRQREIKIEISSSGDAFSLQFNLEKANELYTSSKQHSKQGNNQLAKSLLEQALMIDNKNSKYYQLLGEVHRSLGEIEEALKCFAYVILDNKSNFQFYALWSYGKIHQYNINQLTDNNLSIKKQYEYVTIAVKYYHYALELIPTPQSKGYKNKVDVLNDLGIALQFLGQHEEAIASFQQLMQINPQSFSGLGNMAMSYKALDKIPQAIESIQKALIYSPNDARLHHNLGNIYRMDKNANKAIWHWRKAIEEDSFMVQSRISLGIEYGSNGFIKEGCNYFHDALEAANQFYNLHSNDLGALEARDVAKMVVASCMIPPIYMSNEDIQNTRHQFEQSLDKLLSFNESLYIPDPIITTGSGCLGYYIIYQGYNDRILRTKLAKVYWNSISNLAFQSAHVKKYRNKKIISYASKDESNMMDDNDMYITGRRLRVGFLSAFFFHHSVGLLTKGIITGLSKEKFEVILLRWPSNSDNLTKDLEAKVDHVVTLTKSLETARQQISTLELDILVFTEVGMDTYTYFLAFSQLALRSVVFWGHAITSGIKTIDYFVTSEDFESENPQDKYIECLYKMKGLTTSFPTPALPADNITRAYFNFPMDKIMYLVPQTLYKLHPDFDQLVVKILEKNMDSYIVFITGPNIHYVDLIKKRFDESMSEEVKKRVYIAPPMESSIFLALCRLADVVLDPFPVGGGRSSLEIFSVGTPIVMLYPRTSILQLTYGMYKKMDIFSCIAYNDSQYIDIAIELGLNKTFRNHVSNLIQERNHRLYESKQAIEEWETFFMNITRALPPKYNESSGMNTCPQIDINENESIYEVVLYIESTQQQIPLSMFKGDDPIEIARTFSESTNPPLEPIKKYFLQRILQKGIQRYQNQFIRNYVFDLENHLPNLPHRLTLGVHYGDDFNQLVRYIQAKYKVPENVFISILQYLLKEYPMYDTPEWIAARDFIHVHQDIIMEITTQNVLETKVTLVLTTCKRLYLFQRTIQSLYNLLGSRWNELIYEVIVIDDNSSMEDRIHMITSYPNFYFIFKSIQQKGHAFSMNLLMDVVQTRYVLYVEDDWEFKSSNQENNFIQDALTIFNYGRSKHERIAQVLINDQHGGWKRRIQLPHRNFSYSFHEFGALDPQHKFAYWPGFSLNPGIWDLKVIKKAKLRFETNNTLFERAFSVAYWQAGLHVAYLNHEYSIHIGATPGSNASAYVLNNQTRPFDYVK